MGGKRGFDGFGRLRAGDEICFKMCEGVSTIRVSGWINGRD
jgi:hypothetical protein